MHAPRPSGRSLQRLASSSTRHLPPAWDAAGLDAVRVSAATGAGVAELLAALAGWLVPDVPLPGAGVPLTAGQVEEVRRMLDETA